jgi:hypothetical protein
MVERYSLEQAYEEAVKLQEIIKEGQAQTYAEAERVLEGQEKEGENLIIERGRTLPFEELPDNSIALDGYVQGPQMDLERNRFSFDHHDKVNRQITRASCQQVMDALLLGMDTKDCKVHINDVDGDTVLSVWLLRHPEKANDPKVRMLVESVGGIDSHGPAYEPLDPELAERFFKGVMKPEGDARRTRTYAQADLRQMLDECLKNLDDLMDGKLEYQQQDDNRSYETVLAEKDWLMVESSDFVFDLVYKDGHNRAVAMQRQPDGSIAYTIAKKSELVRNFPVGPASVEGTILYELKQIEPGWGGGSTIGGAPRNPDGSRSRLTPKQVAEVIKRVVERGASSGEKKESQ